MHFLTIFMISHLLEIHWIIQRTIPVTCPGNPSFLDALFKHCDTAFRFSVRDIQFSPQPCKAPQASSRVSSQFLSLKYVFLHHSTKRDFLKVIANFFLPNSVIYLPPVLYEAFYTVSQAWSTCSLAFCPIVMLYLDSLEVLLLLHWAFCPPSLTPKGICKPVFHYSLFLGKNS